VGVAQVAGPFVGVLRPGPIRPRARDYHPDRVAGSADEAGTVVPIGIDPADECGVVGNGRLDLLQTRWPAGELSVLRIQLVLNGQVPALRLALLPAERFELLIVRLGSPGPGDEPADLLVEGLEAPPQLVVARSLLRGQGTQGPAGHFVEDAAGQPILPASPAGAGPAGAGQGQGQGGQRRPIGRRGRLQAPPA
jgi:hypothetical protein